MPSRAAGPRASLIASLSRATALFIAATAAPALAQTSQPTNTDFDSCGVLIRGTECVLFQGAGGKYFVEGDFSHFKVGDSVRVVGELNANCITICQEIDGCVGNAEVFDPLLFPCGTPVQTPFDPCAGLTLPTSLAAAGAGLYFAARRRRSA